MGDLLTNELIALIKVACTPLIAPPHWGRGILLLQQLQRWECQQTTLPLPSLQCDGGGRIPPISACYAESVTLQPYPILGFGKLCSWGFVSCLCRALGILKLLKCQMTWKIRPKKLPAWFLLIMMTLANFTLHHFPVSQMQIDNTLKQNSSLFSSLILWNARRYNAALSLIQRVKGEN